MARPSKIPLKLHGEIQRLSVEGLNSLKIKEWLKKEHNIVAGRTAIQTLTRQATEEHKNAAKKAYAEAVAETAVQDVDILGDKIKKLNDRVDKALKDDDLNALKVTGDLLFKFLDRKLKLAGVDKDDTSLDDQMLDELMDKLGK